MRTGPIFRFSCPPLNFQCFGTQIPSVGCSHRFCRNCLIRSQLVKPLCPVCRASASVPAENLPECEDVAVQSRKADPSYGVREEACQKERTSLMEERRSQNDVRPSTSTRLCHFLICMVLWVVLQIVTHHVVIDTIPFRIDDSVTEVEVSGAGTPQVSHSNPHYFVGSDFDFLEGEWNILSCHSSRLYRASNLLQA